jgi:hypothetical protein
MAKFYKVDRLPVAPLLHRIHVAALEQLAQAGQVLGVGLVEVKFEREKGCVTQLN